MAALRSRDEAAFLALVDEFHPAMLRAAEAYVGADGAAEVVQDTWLAVLRGIDGFEFRSSLRTWIFSILVKRASSAAVRIRRDRLEAESLAVSAPPATSDAGVVEVRMLDAERLRTVASGLTTLPRTQRLVLILREIHGWSSAEVQTLLNLTAGHQRVLLHRARARLRRLLRSTFHGAEGG